MGSKLYQQDADILDYTPAAAKSAGDIVMLPSGIPGMVQNDIAAGALGSVKVRGLVECPKAASVYLWKGQEAWVTLSTGAVSYGGDVCIGVVAETVIGTATTVKVNLNAKGGGLVDMDSVGWITERVGAAGQVVAGGFGKSVGLAFSLTAEAQKAAAWCNKALSVANKLLVQGWLTVVTIGDNAAFDFNFGLASESHASDFDASAKYLAVHLNNALDLFVQSKDGTTTVNATDTTVNLVANTPAFVQFDMSDPADVKLYVNGIAVTPTAIDFSAGGAALFLIAHLEKSADDSPGHIVMHDMRVLSQVDA